MKTPRHFPARFLPHASLRSPRAGIANTTDDVPYALSELPEPVTLSELPAFDATCADCSYPARCSADRTCWSNVTDFSRRVARYMPHRDWGREDVLAGIRTYASSHDGIGPAYRELRNHDYLPAQDTIRKHFGSLKEASLAAGVAPAKRRRSFNAGTYDDRSLDADPDAA